MILDCTVELVISNVDFHITGSIVVECNVYDSVLAHMNCVNVNNDLGFILHDIEPVGCSGIVIVSVIVIVVKDYCSVLDSCRQSCQVNQSSSVDYLSIECVSVNGHIYCTVCHAGNADFSDCIIRICCIIDSDSDFRSNPEYCEVNKICFIAVVLISVEGYVGCVFSGNKSC